MRVLRLSRENPAETEISELHVVVLVEKYISRLEVPVQDHVLLVIALAMTLTQSEEHLHEYLPDYIFRHEVFLCAAFFDELRHVAVFAVFHDDKELFLLFMDNPR